MDKKVLPRIIACVLVIFCIVIVWSLATKGYFRSGSDWKDTPEQALADHAEHAMPDQKSILTAVKILDTVHIEDIAEIFFISEDDTLVAATLVTNEKGQYSVWGYTEEILLDFPSMFLMNGDPEQFNFDSEQYILFPCQHYNLTVYGWCYSGYSFTVNGKTPTKETYTFDCQGKTWSIDYWQVDNIPEDAEVVIEYVD